jgi:hypothetical protein
MKTGYNFDQTTNTVTIFSSFAKKASQVSTLEYDILLKLRKDNPNLKIEKEVKTGKAQLTYKMMEEFINGSYISLAEKEQKRVLYLTEKEGELSDEGFGSLSFCKRCYGEGSKETGRDDRSRRMDEKNR